MTGPPSPDAAKYHAGTSKGSVPLSHADIRPYVAPVNVIGSIHGHGLPTMQAISGTGSDANPSKAARALRKGYVPTAFSACSTGASHPPAMTAPSGRTTTFVATPVVA